ncbi:hypothetical protein [Paracoccus binzhouensis]|uniref:hypothetical protein n=1 Tax=Paracoccus binzhouensis TaxID=2796149 RepID=UPI0018EF2557|nr:hypothetical protein [Paracoccus binzhouensis]
MTPRPATVLACQLGLILLALSLDLITQAQVAPIFKEGHSIETLSALLLAAAALFWQGFGHQRRRQWHIPAILLLMALRELDFDKRFTSEGLLQLRLYSGAAPLWEKAVGAAVLLLILLCGWRLLVLNLPPWWRGLRAGSAACWLAGSAGLLLVVSKSLDGLDRKLAVFGIALPPGLGMLAGRFEELLELGMAVLLVQAVACFARPEGQGPVSRPTLRAAAPWPPSSPPGR